MNESERKEDRRNGFVDVALPSWLIDEIEAVTDERRALAREESETGRFPAREYGDLDEKSGEIVSDLARYIVARMEPEPFIPPPDADPETGIPYGDLT